MSPKKIINYQSSNTETNSSLHAYLIICKQVKMKCSGWNKGEFWGPKLLPKHLFKKLSLNLSPNTQHLVAFIHSGLGQRGEAVSSPKHDNTTTSSCATLKVSYFTLTSPY